MGSISSKKTDDSFPTTVLPIPTGDSRATPGSAEKESTRKIRRLAQHEKVCSEVFEHVFVSNYAVARDREELEKRNIRCIINCAASVCGNAFEDDPHFSYLTLNMVDGGTEDLGWFFPQLLTFMDEAVHARQGVLIHCEKGVSRSCAVACLYGMYSKNLTFHQAVNHVKTRRSISSPNSIFLCNLIEMECVFRGEACNDQKFPVMFRLAHHAPWDPSTMVFKMCRDPVTRIPVQACVGMLQSDGCAVVVPFGTPSRSLFLWRGDGVSERVWTAALRIANMMANVLARLVQYELQGKESTTFTSMFVANPNRNLPSYDDAVRDSILKLREQPSSDCASFRESTDGEQRASWNGSIPALPNAQEDMDAKSVLLYHLVISGDGFANWQPLGVYDRDDLETHGVYYLQCKTGDCTSEGHIWVGQAFLHDLSIDVELLDISQLPDILQSRGLEIPAPCSSPGIVPKLHVEHHEDDRFWELFESGY